MNPHEWGSHNYTLWPQWSHHERVDFKVHKRSVRDHFMVLIEKIKKEDCSRVKGQLHQSWANRTGQATQRNYGESWGMWSVKDDNTREKKQKEQEQAKDIRLKAMESLSETKKWSMGMVKIETRWSNGTEMVTYLREQATGETDRNNNLCNWRKRLR